MDTLQTPSPTDGNQPLVQPPQQNMPPGQPITPEVQDMPVPTIQAPVLNQPIVVDQDIPMNQVKVKTTPVSMVCPFCKNNITTMVRTEFNWLNFCFCFFFRIIWLIVKIESQKELNCNDATHFCPSCGQIIGQYSAC